jgi:glycosyltransferase involved in cell wall biosynthesis
MRIAILGARGFPHTHGGFETFIGQLAPRLIRRGHEVMVYNRDSLFPEHLPSYQGVRLRYLPSIETKSLGTPTHTLFAALDVIRQDVDIVFVVNVGNWLHCLILRAFGKRVAINVDGLDWERTKWGTVARRYIKLGACFIGRIAQEVVTDSTAMQRVYLEEFQTTSTMIPYGADVQRPERPEILGLTIEAFQQLRTDRSLLIVGEADYRDHFVTSLRATAGPRVRFLGHITDPVWLKELYCGCYAYIHGHSVGGTNPSLLQALGCGACAPFNREVLLDKYGILYDRDARHLTEKLQQVEDDPAIAEHFRHQAPERIQQAYTGDRVVDQYEALFNRMLQTG